MAINTRGAGKMYLDAMLTLWEQRKREQEQQRQYQQQWAMQNAANQFTLGRDRTQAEQQAERDRMLAAQTAERDRQLAAQRRRESETTYARESDADVMNNRGNVQALQNQFPEIYGNMPVDAFQSGVNDKMYGSLVSQAQRQIEEQQDMERALEYRRQLNLPIEQGRKYSVSDPDIQIALRREQNKADSGGMPDYVAPNKQRIEGKISDILNSNISPQDKYDKIANIDKDPMVEPAYTGWMNLDGESYNYWLNSTYYPLLEELEKAASSQRDVDAVSQKNSQRQGYFSQGGGGIPRMIKDLGPSIPRALTAAEMGYRNTMSRAFPQATSLENMLTKPVIPPISPLLNTTSVLGNDMLRRSTNAPDYDKINELLNRLMGGPPPTSLY